MTEEYLVALVPWGGFCWWAGGRGLPPFRKGWRRYLLPSTIAFLMLTFTQWAWWRIVVNCLALAGANSLGYGNDSTTLSRSAALLGVSFVPCLFHAPLWMGGGSILVISLAWVLSHRVNAFGHAWVELLAGLVQSASIVHGLAS